MDNDLFATVLLCCVLGFAVAKDIAERRVPNELVAIGLALGIGWNTLAGRPFDGWIGAVVGLLPLLPLFAIRWVGAGDVKLLAVIGSFTGAASVLPITVFSVLAGGFLGGAALLVSRRAGLAFPGNRPTIGRPAPTDGTAHGVRDESAAATRSVYELPYAVALAAGTAIYLFGGRL